MISLLKKIGEKSYGIFLEPTYGKTRFKKKKTSKLLNQYVAVTQVCSISGLIFGFRKKKLKGKKLKTQAKNSIFRHFFLNQKIKFSLNFLYANLTTTTLTIY